MDPAPEALRILFMGTPEYAAVSLEALVSSRHQVAAVLTRPDKPAGRGKRLQACAVKKLAIEHGIEVLDPASPRDHSCIRRVHELGLDIGACVAYGRILPAELLYAPRLGCINAHGSLLPRLRGAAPIERALLEGESETGVTIMQMNEGMDEGDIILARRVTIEAGTDAGSLRQRLSHLSAELLLEALDSIASGKAVAKAQDHDAATYAPPLDKREAQIDWSADAVQVDRVIRAFAPSPGAFTFDGSKRLKILAARVEEDAAKRCEPGTEAVAAGPASNGSASNRDKAGEPGAVVPGDGKTLRVRCGNGIIAVSRLQPEGKRPMSAADYLRGHHQPTHFSTGGGLNPARGPGARRPS